jgi:hypothetical protein
MSRVSDKLSANIRTVKAGQESAGAEQAKTTSDKPAAKPARMPASRKQKRTATTLTGDVPESDTELFPARVWPD